ncbi:MAG: hypothetical protein NC923_04235 [Candidatus Omnitrophica bacterium]|nr:hypothetical protein [Candidatus Omnitrophota bacterium]
MIKRKIQNIVIQEGISLLITICLLVFSPNYLLAEESVQFQLSEIEQGDINNTRPDVAEIEMEIYNLNAPLDTEKMSWIYNKIAQCSGEEQERLNKILEEKIEESFKNNALSQEFETKPLSIVEDNVQYEQSNDYASIARKIDALKLGNDATVEDLRARDNIIATISGISDPKLRYDLLDYLDRKEKSAN